MGEPRSGANASQRVWCSPRRQTSDNTSFQCPATGASRWSSPGPKPVEILRCRSCLIERWGKRANCRMPSKMPSRLSSWQRLRTTGGGRSRWLARPANWRPSWPEPRNRCGQATAVQRRLNGAFLTPKELRPIAQGCPQQRATLGQRMRRPSTLKGLRQLSTADDGTPLGYWGALKRFPRVARFARNPGLEDATPSE